MAPRLHLACAGEDFDELAQGARAGCPIVKALAALPITLERNAILNPRSD
jgi:organic hydroperoxide reductase OsmC/OhrA